MRSAALTALVFVGKVSQPFPTPAASLPGDPWDGLGSCLVTALRAWARGCEKSAAFYGVCLHLKMRENVRLKRPKRHKSPSWSSSHQEKMRENVRLKRHKRHKSPSW